MSEHIDSSPYFTKLKINDALTTTVHRPPGGSFKKRRSIADQIYGMLDRENENYKRIFHLSLILLDKYHIIHYVQPENLQITATACLYIAVIHEITNQILPHKSDLMNHVNKILDTLNWEIDLDTPHDALMVYIQNLQNPIEETVVSLSGHITDIFVISAHYLRYEPMFLAKNVVEFASLLIAKPPNLEQTIDTNSHYMLCWHLLKKSSKWNLEHFDAHNGAPDVASNVASDVTPLNIPLITCKLSLLIVLDLVVQNQTNTLPKHSKHLSKLIVHKRLEKLGRGTYGTVYKVKLTDDSVVAAKRYTLPFNGLDDDLETHYLRELNILKSIDHINIVKMYGYGINNENNLEIYLELMDHSLEDNLRDNPMLPIESKKIYISDLLHGVDYLHSNNIIHRDLSYQNIMIKNCRLKIIDFGMSRRLSAPCKELSRHTCVCTLIYRPIEILLGATSYKFEFDMWSVGCVIHYILTRKHMFEYNYYLDPDVSHESSEMRTIHMIKTYRDIRISELEKNYPLEANLLKKMLTFDPSERITASEAIDQCN